jgi:hypothetical protein
MANVSAPFGFQQRSGTGSSPTYEQIERLVDYNASAIYAGDPVATVSDGTVAAGGSLPGTVPLAGIFIGCKYLSVSQKRSIWNNYWPGSDVASGNSVTAYVVNDPNAQFVVQSGNSNTTAVTGVTQSNIGSNMQFSYGTGTAANGISGAFIDVYVTPVTTGTLPFRVVNLLTSPPGAPGTASGAFNLVIVAFNNVETKNLTAPF